MCLTTFCQSVGIGTTTPDPSSLLDLNSPDKGLLIPRMSMVKRDGISNPARGLIVYVMDDSGFYINNGAWRRLTPADETWSIKGNSGMDTAIHFIGTKDNSPLMFRVNNVTRMQLDSFGRLKLNSPGNNLFIGYETGLNNTGIENQFAGFRAGYTNTSGYGNHFIGYRAGFSNTTGNENHFEGREAGMNNTVGYYNYFSGLRAGRANISGVDNYFSGSDAGISNTAGSFNHFTGNVSGYLNSTGDRNQFSGYVSGYSNTTGERNHFIGFQSGRFNTTGSANHFNGHLAGWSNSTADSNHFDGYKAGYNNSTGEANYFSGNRAGENNRTGSMNQFTGFHAGFSNTTGYTNHFSGFETGYFNTTGSENYFSGALAGYNNTEGNLNQFTGILAGANNRTGHNNYFSGNSAGFSNRSGYNNTMIGHYSDLGDSNLTNAGAIGYRAIVSQSNSFVIGGSGVDAVNVGIGTTAPATKLDVNSNNANSNIATFRAAGGFGQILVTQGATITDLGSYATGGYTGTNSAGDFAIRTGAIRRMFFQHSTGHVGIGTDSPSETLHVAGNIAVDGIILNPAFLTPVFQGTWTNYGDGYAPAGYYKDKEGRVHLRGTVMHGGASVNTLIFTLPEGYRPSTSGRLRFTVNYDGGSGTSCVLVRADGEVQVSCVWPGFSLSLDGISFRAD